MQTPSNNHSQQQVLLSVIIPIYGVEKYMERCARSLFEQTLTSGIEFIFVNDCTPDNSITILEKTLKQYPNRIDQVKIIHLEKNGGSAKARPAGLKHASGIYIANCDSDDWVEPDMYKTLLDYALAHDSDMVWCDFYRSTADGIDTYIPQICISDKYTLISAYLSGMYNKSNFLGVLWNRIYKKSLYTPDFVYPQHDMTEDLVTILQLTLNSNNIHYVQKALYHYYFNNLSISYSAQYDKIIKRTEQIVSNSNLIFEILEKHSLLGRYKKEIVKRKWISKDALFDILQHKQYRNLWRTIYPEVHAKIWTNPYCSLKAKLRYFCLVYKCCPYWLIDIMCKLITHITSRH